MNRRVRTAVRTTVICSGLSLWAGVMSGCGSPTRTTDTPDVTVSTTVSAAGPEAAPTPASTAAGPPPSAAPSTTSKAPTTEAYGGSAGASAGPAPGGCHVRGTGLYVLPDPACTPGATDPAVTPADIDSTICRAGWTSTIRPPESYTERLKRQQMQAYGDTGPLSDFEEDHLIPLELGGNPTSPANLWPEPGASPNPKDRVEDAARAAVCAGTLHLAAAQAAIARNWISFGQQLGVISGG